MYHGLLGPVVIPGVVGLIALEGLLGFSFPFYPFYPYNNEYHNGFSHLRDMQCPKFTRCSVPVLYRDIFALYALHTLCNTLERTVARKTRHIHAMSFL